MIHAINPYVGAEKLDVDFPHVSKSVCLKIQRGNFTISIVADNSLGTMDKLRRTNLRVFYAQPDESDRALEVTDKVFNGEDNVEGTFDTLQSAMFWIDAQSL
ncbi:hypothetical protein [Achromobacter phage Motura]|uniref:Uncharacterized protein n=1 Tax=Achromobacter phage Motura TaxID=2591403 RepID=A0A514CSV1_9CAUD|nr:hypothetical protein H1O15_gp242 [Achromobacter phage Motura]QDH83546.1 hypothetical protein [Achromobacter phage Motura]